MSLRINNNIEATDTLRNLVSAQSMFAQSMQRLSSGKRINSAADDAAGYAISNKLLAQQKGLDQAQANAQDGISLVQTANGGLQTIQNLLQRYRQLAVQSANDTNTGSDRQALQAEGTQITQEITQIASTTQFNTKNLLDGSLGSQGVLSGANTLGTANATYNGNKYSDGNSPTVNTGSLAATDNTGATDTYTLTLGAAVGTVGTVGGAATGNIAGALTAGTTINNGTNYIKSYTGTAPTGSTNPTGVPAGAYSLTISGASGDATIQVKSTDTFQNVLDAINGASSNTGVSASFSATAGITLTNSVAGSSQVVSATGQAGLLRGLGLMATDATNYANSTAFTAAQQQVVTASAAGTDGSATLTDSAGLLGGAGHALTANGNSFTDASTGFSYNLNQVSNLNATGTATFTINNSGNATLQVGANANQSLTVAVGDMRSNALGISTLDITTQAGATSAITTLDSAIQMVSKQAATLGAVQNRLSAAINNLSIGSENMQAAFSAITNVNMAQESTNLATAQILQQSSTAMLAQANQAPQGVLKLLG